MGKKSRTVVTALAVCTCILLLGAVTGRAAPGDGTNGTVSAGDFTESGKGMSFGEESAAGPNAAGDIISLQIPQKIEVVIDPWEMDGKGQVYSEWYVIQNRGTTEGTLTLTFLCMPGQGRDTAVKQDRDGVHGGTDKSIYMEMVTEDGTGIAMGPEGAVYRTELTPGEELRIRFTGEVNENTSESWGDGDVVVEGVYSWDASINGAGDSGGRFTVSGNDFTGNSSAKEEESSIRGETVSGNDFAGEGSGQNPGEGNSSVIEGETVSGNDPAGSGLKEEAGGHDGGGSGSGEATVSGNNFAGNILGDGEGALAGEVVTGGDETTESDPVSGETEGNNLSGNGSGK